jgi:hypothetical protein
MIKESTEDYSIVLGYRFIAIYILKYIVDTNNINYLFNQFNK